MRIFISWSGERSKEVALLLRDWLICVLQASTPWMSDVDIDRGAIWFSEISKALDGCIIGIICLTKGNLNKPWLLFEAGALAKGLTSSLVCTLLVDLLPADVGEPMSQFNHTLPTHEGMLKLVKTLNSRMGDRALTDNILEKVFSTNWPEFESRFKDILSKTPEDKLPVRKDQDIMGEILSSIRRLENRVASIDSPSNSSSNCYDENRSGSNINRITHRNLKHVEKEIYEQLSNGLPMITIINEISSHHNVSYDEIMYLVNLNLKKIYSKHPLVSPQSS